MRNLLVAACVVLSGCTSFDRPAEFALERYEGATRLEQLLSKVNREENLNRPCGGNRLCQTRLPSRSEVQSALQFDCKAYTMAKAYALQDAGIHESRMRTAVFPFRGGRHMVLVVDERYVLDNFHSDVRRIEQYRNTALVRYPIPAALMARPLLANQL